MRTLILLIGFSLACGGSPAEPRAESNSGDEQIRSNPDLNEYEDEDELEIDEPEPTGPGRIHVVIRMRGEEQAGTVAVLSSRGEAIAEGAAGATFDVPAGSYRVQGMLDPALLPGHIGRDERVTVEPGRTSEVVFTYEVARIRLNVRRNGRAISNWRMVLTREGVETPVEIQSSTEHIEIAPGRYSGVLTAGSHRVEVTGLIFQGGATMDVPVNVN